MSALSQFPPYAAASSGIKTVQNGFVSTSSLSTGSGQDTRYLDITISSVNTSKAVVSFQGTAPLRSDNVPFLTPLYSTEGTTSNYAWAAVTSRLTSSTNVRLSVAASYTGVGIVGQWTVIESN